MLFVIAYRAIASVSTVTVLTVAILIWTGVMLDDSMPIESFVGLSLGETKQHFQLARVYQRIQYIFHLTVVDEPDYVTMLKVYGMIAFQFDVHPMLMTIEVDMQDKRKIGNAVCYAFAGMILEMCIFLSSTL